MKQLAQVSHAQTELTETHSSQQVELVPEEPETSREEPEVIKEQGLSPRMKAIIAINLYCFTAIAYQSFAKVVLDTGFNSVDLCLMRTFMNFLFSISTVTTSGKHLIKDVPSEYRLTLLIRSLVGVVAFTCMVFAVKYLPIFIVTIVFNTAPFWTAIFAWLLLGNKPSLKDIPPMIGCFSGVVVIALAKQPSDGDEEKDSSMRLVGIVCISITSLCFSFVSVVTRKLKDVHFSLILFHYTLIGSFLLFLYLVGEHLVQDKGRIVNLRLFNYSWSQYRTASISAFFNAIGMNLHTIAFQNEKNSSFLTLVGYMGLVYSFLVDIIAFDYSFSGLELIGACVVVVFTVGAIYQKLRESQLESKNNS